MSPSLAEKAKAIVSRGGVRSMEGHLFEVDGRSGTYVVVLGRTKQWCLRSDGKPCLGFMHQGRCKHIMAAAMRYQGEEA